MDTNSNTNSTTASPSGSKTAGFKRKALAGVAGLVAAGVSLGFAVPAATAQIDGTQSSAQAAAQTEQNEQGQREGRARGNQADRADRVAKAEALADFLGVSVDDLKAAHEAGQTLAEFAEANGVSESALVDWMVAKASERIDAKVADGSLDADRAEEIKSSLEERITARVNGETSEGPGRGQGQGPRGPRGAGFGGPAQAGGADA